MKKWNLADETLCPTCGIQDSSDKMWFLGKADDAQFINAPGAHKGNCTPNVLINFWNFFKFAKEFQS